MMPAAPFVGAVTTRPPAAFSSLTARAKQFTQSMMRRGSRVASSCASWRASSGALRLSFMNPGSVPSVEQPCSTQSFMACQIPMRPS